MRKPFIVNPANLAPSTCHPDRRGMSKGKYKGMCRSCYSKLYRQARVALGQSYSYPAKAFGICQGLRYVERGTIGPPKLRPCGRPATYGKRKGLMLCHKHAVLLSYRNRARNNQLSQHKEQQKRYKARLRTSGEA